MGSVRLRSTSTIGLMSSPHEVTDGSQDDFDRFVSEADGPHEMGDSPNNEQHQQHTRHTQHAEHNGQQNHAENAGDSDRRAVANGPQPNNQSHGHSHGVALGPTSRRVKRALAAIVIPMIVATSVGLGLLWPNRSSGRQALSGPSPSNDLVSARVTGVDIQKCATEFEVDTGQTYCGLTLSERTFTCHITRNREDNGFGWRACKLPKLLGEWAQVQAWNVDLR